MTRFALGEEQDANDNPVTRFQGDLGHFREQLRLLDSRLGQLTSRVEGLESLALPPKQDVERDGASAGSVVPDLPKAPSPLEAAKAGTMSHAGGSSTALYDMAQRPVPRSLSPLSPASLMPKSPSPQRGNARRISEDAVLEMSLQLTQHTNASLGFKASLWDALLPGYYFQASTWDALLFTFSEPVGLAGSFFIIGLAVACMSIQLGFMAMIVANFSESSFGPEVLDYLRAWRVQVGHDAAHLDKVTGTSLASRVCQTDPSLNVGVRQALLLEEINDYLPEDHSGTFATYDGQVMCCFAMMVWSFSVIRKTRPLFSKSAALHRLLFAGLKPRLDLRHVGDGWELLALSRFYALLWMGTLLYRAVVAAMLLVWGSIYLVNTIDVRALLVDALALEVVLVIDELAFQALAPVQTCIFIGALRPVPIKSRRRWKGLDAKVVMLSLGIIVGLGLLVTFPLMNQVDSLRQARDALCEGNLNFVYSKTNFPPYVMYADTRPHEGGLPDVFPVDAVSSIKDGKRLDELEDIRVPELQGSIYSLDLVSKWEYAEGSLVFGQGCADIAPDGEDMPAFGNFELIMEAWRTAASDSSLGGCADGRRLCNEDTLAGVYARQLCPVTCGCHRPDTGLAMDHPSTGCPPQCARGDEYRAVLESAPCRDQALEELQADPRWQEYADAFLEPLRRWPDNLRPLFQEYRKILLQEGCNTVRMLGQDTCDSDGTPFRTVRFRCPVACRCRGGMKDCPLTCGARPPPP